MIRQSLILAAAALFAFQATAHAAQPQACHSFADNMTKRVVAVFHDRTQSEAQKRQALASIFQQAVDTDWIGKFVLGRYWRLASPAERQQYLTAYRAYLTDIYVSKFHNDDGYSVDDIKLTELIPTPAQPGQFQAKSLIQRKGEEDVQVNYLLDQSAGACKVHDIQIEGVSLLTTERADFQAAAASGGVKNVIAAMESQLSQMQM